MANNEPQKNKQQARRSSSLWSNHGGMEGAFTHVGNHLISDSAAAINAGDDDLSTLDPDESLLYGRFGGRGGLGNARRRDDDDDNETEAPDDDDAESLASAPVGALKALNLRNTPEEDKKLPAHACAYVHTPSQHIYCYSERC